MPRWSPGGPCLENSRALTDSLRVVRTILCQPQGPRQCGQLCSPEGSLNEHTQEQDQCPRHSTSTSCTQPSSTTHTHISGNSGRQSSAAWTWQCPGVRCLLLVQETAVPGDMTAICGCAQQHMWRCSLSLILPITRLSTTTDHVS